ncbi:MAG: RES domain-containing protein [bacterium]|nr:RES domain-containing protein [bacterium]
MSPEQHPPPRYQGTPHRYLLREGATLTRIHSSLFGAGEFNPTVASSPFGGGRFDSTPGDEYGYLYASEDDATAVCETLLRDLPADDYGCRSAGRRHASRALQQRIAVIARCRLLSE